MKINFNPQIKKKTVIQFYVQKDMVGELSIIFLFKFV